MRVPEPKANTTTEAYLAYKAGFLEEGELKPSLYEPTLHFDAWLAYWAGLVGDYPTDKNGDPEMLTDEEALVAYLSGVTDTYPEEIKDPYDVRITGYLRYLVSARFGRPDYPVNNEEFYLSNMKPPVVTNDTPSSSIELDDTAEAPFIDVKVYGDTSQTTYSGKNLASTLNVSGNIQVTGLNSFIANRDNGRTADIYFSPRLPAGTYTISYDVEKNTTNTEGIRCRIYVVDDSGTTGLVDLPNYTGHIEYTFTSTTEVDRLYFFISNSMPSGSTATVTNLQVEASSTATSYEPYVGGIPSPNPDYPQAAQTVTGSQVVAVTGGDGESAEYEINLGDIELCKIGTHQDYIYKSGDDWYLHKETKKKTLTGSDGWIQQAPTHINVLNTYITMYGWRALRSRYTLWCNMIKYTDGIVGESNDSYINVCAPNARATNLLVDVSKAEFPTIRAWTTFLNTHNLLVYYALATPTDTKITDSTLISQLEALAGADTYNEKTFIKVTANDPNLPALLKVEAYKY